MVAHLPHHRYHAASVGIFGIRPDPLHAVMAPLRDPEPRPRFRLENAVTRPERKTVEPAVLEVVEKDEMAFRLDLGHIAPRHGDRAFATAHLVKIKHPVQQIELALAAVHQRLHAPQQIGVELFAHALLPLVQLGVQTAQGQPARQPYYQNRQYGTGGHQQGPQ